MKRAVRLPCGCQAVWNDAEEQYNPHCHCSPERQAEARKQEREAALQRRIESQRRLDAPLYRKPFSILR